MSNIAGMHTNKPDNYRWSKKDEVRMHGNGVVNGKGGEII
jgi:hypothetical protein